MKQLSLQDTIYAILDFPDWKDNFGATWQILKVASRFYTVVISNNYTLSLQVKELSAIELS